MCVLFQRAREEGSELELRTVSRGGRRRERGVGDGGVRRLGPGPSGIAVWHGMDYTVTASARKATMGREEHGASSAMRP